MRIPLTIAVVMLTTVTSFAQTPYAGMQSRPIKALSEQQVADLQAGRGMGLALAAELNGYPGLLTFWNWRTSWSCQQTSESRFNNCLHP